MNNKKIFGVMFLLMVIVLVFSISNVSAQEDVCCQQLKTGEACQNAPISQCGEGSTAPTACDQTPYCQLGTCIDTNAGICMSNTPKSVCEAEGNSWSVEDKEDIKICQEGCCLIGEDVAFMTQNECKQIATDYGVNTTFREDIRNELTCFAAATPNVKGACVFENSRDCTMTIKDTCLKQGGNFNEGLLCTATQLETNCAKTENTQCHNGGVYFLDSCGNLANVYDSSMFSKNENEWTAEMEDYWRYLQEAKCTAKNNYQDCGNCNYLEGSICKAYDRNNPQTQKPTYGTNVCADLSCEYHGKLMNKENLGVLIPQELLEK